MQYNKTGMGTGTGRGKPQQLFTILTSVAAATEKKDMNRWWGGRGKSNLFLFVLLAFCFLFYVFFFFALRTEINHKAQSLPALHHPQMAGPLASSPPPARPLSQHLFVYPAIHLQFIVFHFCSGLLDLWAHLNLHLATKKGRAGGWAFRGERRELKLKAIRFR